MSQKITVELSDELYTIIQQQATQDNISPAQVASASLEQYFQDDHHAANKASGQGKKDNAKLQADRRRFEQHFGAVDLGYATGAGNEGIDAGLEREYADAHEKP